LTIAWVSETAEGKKQVWNLQPHTAKDFNVRGLADRIRDLEQLHYVLTQDDRKVTKEEMFNRYYTKAANPPNAQPSDGYVKAEIQVTIPNIATMSLGSPSHEGSITSPRSPASGYGDHHSIMSSPSQSGPVHYEMSTNHNDQMEFNENNQNRNQNQDQNQFNPGFDGFDTSNTIDVNELLSKVN